MNNWDRFWSFVRKRGPDECWPWTGAKGPGGEGKFWLDGVMTYAHRAAWTLTHGPIPFRNRVVHTCTTKESLRCCNPAHLMCVGTKPKQPRSRLRGSAMAPAALIDLRRAKGLTQIEAAALVKISPGQYSRWENGRSAISASRADHIAERFRTVPDASS